MIMLVVDDMKNKKEVVLENNVIYLDIEYCLIYFTDVVS
jgi:hypothetical protein